MSQISNEKKAKAFANYYGQPLSVNNQKKMVIDGKFIDLILSGELASYSFSEDVKIVLKPFNQMTDDDAIEVAKILGKRYYEELFPEEKPQDLKINKMSGVYYIGDCLINLTTKVITYRRHPDSVAMFQAYQYLQSKGYDLPNYFLGGKTLHESGLAIYE